MMEYVNLYCYSRDISTRIVLNTDCINRTRECAFKIIS